MKPRTVISLALLSLWLLSTLLQSSGAAFRANSVQGVASPYFFDLPRWEITKLWNEAASRIARRGENSSGQADIPLVEDYFRLGKDVATLQGRLKELTSAQPQGLETKETETRLQAVRRQRADEAPRVSVIIARQIGQALTEAGISPLPPVLLAFDAPPQLLVVSRRERIDLKETLLLDPKLTLSKTVRLEQQIEALPPPQGQRWGLSALVEPLGGLALYPSLIPDTDSPEEAIPAIAHEWVHQYLFFHPLGRRYGADNQMTTINETVADMVGKEIGGRVLQEYGRKVPERPAKRPSGFDFDQEMRQTRLKVDALLSEGKVPEAEKYMEERRQFLAANGYHLRRLNQAYFAFHGSYGNSSASVSPVGGWLKAIRARSPSLGDFLRTVAGIASYDELESLAQNPPSFQR